jgi:hypothetical protein
MKPRFYVLLTHYTRPKFANSSKQSGWNKTQGLVQHDEEFAVKTRVSNRDIQSASIILDLINSKVIVSKFGDRNYEKLLEYVLKHYRSYIVKACQEQGITIEGITNGSVSTETQEAL